MMFEKPSATSTPPPRNPPPGLLLDENLSSSDIADWLRRFPLEWQIELHTDHFPRGLADVELIRECGARGWALVTCDDRIRRVPTSKAAVLRHKVRVFMFANGNFQGAEYAAALVVGRSQITKLIRQTADHLFARIQRNGDVVMLEPKESRGTLTARERTNRRYGADVNKENNGTL
jgi:hypothetical protein